MPQGLLPGVCRGAPQQTDPRRDWGAHWARSLRYDSVRSEMRAARLLLVCALLGCSRERSAPSPALDASLPGLAPAEAKPDPAHAIDTVVLITVDALRADPSWTGYQVAKTPNLLRLAERSIVFTRTYSLANLTTASLAGLLSSRYPSELSREGCIFGKYDLSSGLAPALRAANVETFAAHGHALFAGRAAPSAGFDQWKLVSGAGGRLQKEGAVVSGATADLLIEYLAAERPIERKVFAWAHFADQHDTYVPHAKFPPTSPGSRGLYDGEVAYTDAAIGRVLDAIERSESASRTAIVVTSDHGEAFGEHGNVYHGTTLYEEEVRVPLIVHVPGEPHRVIQTPRGAIDMAPTIAALLGVSPPPEWKGTSLLTDLRETATDRPIIIDLPAMSGRSAQKAVIRGSVKALFDAAGERVFDLREDPKELGPIDGPRAETAIRDAKQDLSRLQMVDAEPCVR